MLQKAAGLRQNAKIIGSLLLMTLLFSGCSLKSIIEELDENQLWASKWFVQIELEWFQTVLAPCLTILATIALGALLWWIGINMKHGIYVNEKIFRGFILMFAAGSLPFFIPVTTEFGQFLQTGEFTSLQNILDALHLDLTTNITDLVTSAWAVILVFALPILSKVAQVTFLVIAIGSVLASIIGRSLKGVRLTLSFAIGWLTFIFAFFQVLMPLFAAIYGEDPSSIEQAVMNGAWILSVLTSMVFFYFILPWMVYHRIPDTIWLNTKSNALTVSGYVMTDSSNGNSSTQRSDRHGPNTGGGTSPRRSPENGPLPTPSHTQGRGNEYDYGTEDLEARSNPVEGGPLPYLAAVAVGHSSEVLGNESVLCEFCGKEGHSIDRCPDVVDAEFEDNLALPYSAGSINVIPGVLDELETQHDDRTLPARSETKESNEARQVSSGAFSNNLVVRDMRGVVDADASGPLPHSYSSKSARELSQTSSSEVNSTDSTQTIEAHSSNPLPQPVPYSGKTPHVQVSVNSLGSPETRYKQIGPGKDASSDKDNTLAPLPLPDPSISPDLAASVASKMAGNGGDPYSTAIAIAAGRYANKHSKKQRNKPLP